jgi:hypothetical protein
LESPKKKTVGSDGNAMQATRTAGFFRGHCEAGGPLGNFTDPDLRFPLERIVRNIQKCFCGLDIMSTKWAEVGPRSISRKIP